ncbi:MAG: thioredoxin family protein [Planctomycetota bacterium]|nr:thioredoxin family protein [Planctomycetota bacterium]
MPKPETLHEANFFQELAQIAGPCLIGFGTPFCGACQRLHRLFDQQEWGFPVYYLDAGDNPGLIQEFEIFHVPQMILFVDGEVHASISCPLTVREIQSAVDRAKMNEPIDD